MAKGGGKNVTRADLSRVLGIQLTTVDQWLARGMPVQVKGGRGREYRFNTAEVVEWMLEREAAKRDAISVDVLDFEEARARKIAAEAEEAELDLRARRGELVEIDSAAELAEAAFATVRLRLLSLPSKVAPQLAPLRSAAKCRRLLEDEFREVLDELVAGGILASRAVERGREKIVRKGARGRSSPGAPAAA